MLNEKNQYDCDSWLVSLVYSESEKGLFELLDRESGFSRVLIEGRSKRGDHPFAYLFSLRKVFGGIEVREVFGIPGREITKPADCYYLSSNISAQSAQELIARIQEEIKDKAFNEVRSDKEELSSEEESGNDDGSDLEAESDEEKEVSKKAASPRQAPVPLKTTLEKAEFAFFAASKDGHHIRFQESAFNWARKNFLSVAPSEVVQQTISLFRQDAMHAHTPVDQYQPGATLSAMMRGLGMG